MKKIIAVFLTFIIIMGIVFAIANQGNVTTIDSNEKITVVTSLFPEYDFVKQIGKEKVNVQILLLPGTESHTYEPTPKDIININESDMFIYTSDEMEPWATKISTSIDSDTKILQAANNINLIKLEHDHSEHEEEHEEIHEYDAHVWLDPFNAIKMVENITEELCKISPEDAEYFRKNAEDYKKELTDLDNEIQQTVNNSKRNKLVFGGEFAYIYFIERYGLEYATAYDSCGEGAEPSVAKIKQIVDTITNEQIPVIFYQELSTGKIANMIADETNAKTLIFHTIHNVTSEDLENGVTYITLMKNNLANIKEALN